MPVTTIPDTPQQAEFDKKYITIGEVRKLTGLAPSTVMIARNKGLLPNAIACNGGYVWERAALLPYLTTLLNKHSSAKRAPALGWDAVNNKPCQTPQS